MRCPVGSIIGVLEEGGVDWIGIEDSSADRIGDEEEELQRQHGPNQRR
jgi:hypothetical protein